MNRQSPAAQSGALAAFGAATANAAFPRLLQVSNGERQTGMKPGMANSPLQGATPSIVPGPAFRERLLAEIPRLRALALALSRSVHLADDLVQETLLRAWSNASSFAVDQNFRGWLGAILRNTYYSLYRRRGREIQDSEGIHAALVAVAPAQHGAVDLADLWSALARLPAENREALILVGAAGFSYLEAAGHCGIAVGTVKSRLNRGRAKLIELLEPGEATMP